MPVTGQPPPLFINTFDGLESTGQLVTWFNTSNVYTFFFTCSSSFLLFQITEMKTSKKYHCSFAVCSNQSLPARLPHICSLWWSFVHQPVIQYDTPSLLSTTRFPLQPRSKSQSTHPLRNAVLEQPCAYCWIKWVLRHRWTSELDRCNLVDTGIILGREVPLLCLLELTWAPIIVLWLACQELGRHCWCKGRIRGELWLCIKMVGW